MGLTLCWIVEIKQEIKHPLTKHLPTHQSSVASYYKQLILALKPFYSIVCSNHFTLVTYSPNQPVAKGF